MQADDRADKDADRRGEWLQRLDEECPYQVVLPRGPGGDQEVSRLAPTRIHQ